VNAIEAQLPKQVLLNPVDDPSKKNFDGSLPIKRPAGEKLEGVPAAETIKSTSSLTPIGAYTENTFQNKMSGGISMLTEKSEYAKINKSVNENLAKILAEESVLLDELKQSEDLDTILEVVKEFVREFYKEEAFGNGIKAGRAVLNGKIMQIMKEKVIESGENWDDYAKKNIPGMSLRTIQKQIRISKIPGVDRHLAYGIERLNLIAGVVKSSKSQDPISELLSENNMELDPNVEIPFEEFKRQIDKIGLQQKALKEGVDLPSETADKIAERGLHINDEDWKIAQVVEAISGQGAKHLETLMATETKTNTVNPGNNKKKKPQSKVKSFNKLAVEFKQLITEAKATTDKSILKSIDLGSVNDLIADLETLKLHLAGQ
jgi:hypothetical protein